MIFEQHSLRRKLTVLRDYYLLVTYKLFVTYK